MRTRILIAALALAAVVPDEALANGRPPQSVKLRFRPGSDQDMLLGVTFGLMLSHDNAATWRWICESAVGFEGTFDPDYEYSASGAIFATTFDGLRFTRDGCVWSPVPSPLDTWLVTQVAIGPNGTLFAGAADPVRGSGIFRSTDDGASWQPTASMMQTFDWFETLEVAPSDPQRVYVTGYRLSSGQPRARLLFRSLNAGGNWEQLQTTAFVGTEFSDLRLMAIDPTNPDVVYMKLTFATKGIADALFRTDNWSRPTTQGGPTWTRVLQVEASITAVTVRDNGEVWAATQTQGTHKSTDGGNTFTQVPGLTFEAACLEERRSDDSLWMCANHLPPDLMALGRSPSGAAGSWEVKLQYKDIVAPVRCPAGNDQHDDCEANLWCGIADNFGVTSTEIDCSAQNVDAPSLDPPDPKPCCGAGGGPPGLELGLGALGLLLLTRRRRPRVSC